MNKVKILIFAVIIVIIISTTFALTNYDTQTNEIGITALLAKQRADEIAHDWNQNATLISLYTYSNMIDNGTYSNWRFSYVVTEFFVQDEGGPLTTDYNTPCLNVLLFSDGRNISITESGRYVWQVISDFQIDSDQAYQIAITNNTINSFVLEKNTESPGYQMLNLSGNVTWEIEFYRNSQREVQISILIDAMTGEIMSVNRYD